MDAANELLQQAFEHHKAGRLDKAEPAYNALLNRALKSDQILYLLGDLYARKEYNGLAIHLLNAAVTVNPSLVEAWINLGVAFKHEHYNADAKHAWMKAYELAPGNIEVVSNMSTLYADTGKPKEALEWAGKALAIDPDHWQSIWNSALAYLSMRDWENGWKCYEKRFSMPEWSDRSQTGLPVWDGQTPSTVYFHGEQGVGDEIMFLSCIQDAIAHGATPIFEVNPKVAPLVRATWPGAQVFTTVDEFIASGTKAGFRCSLASLARLYRNRDSDFPGEPYLRPNPDRVAYYRGALAALGPGPYFGIAWVGGVKSTRIHLRSLPLMNFDPIRVLGTCVSLQYGPHSGECTAEELPVLGVASTGEDFGEQAALIAALDAVVTVVQTVVHLAGAVGTRAYVLTPSTPSWRYGVSGDTIPWYKSVTLFRQPPGENWGTTIATVTNRLAYDFRTVPGTERKAA